MTMNQAPGACHCEPMALHQAAVPPIMALPERRRAPRYPLGLPLRLRLGDELLHGRAGDLSTGGVGLQVAPQPEAQHRLVGMLGTQHRVALEFLLGEMRLIARVRILRICPTQEGTAIGLALDDRQEAERLLRRLEACGVWKQPRPCHGGDDGHPAIT